MKLKIIMTGNINTTKVINAETGEPIGGIISTMKIKLFLKHVRRFISFFFERRTSNFNKKLWEIAKPILAIVAVVLGVMLVLGSIILSLTIFTCSHLNFAEDFTLDNIFNTFAICLPFIFAGTLLWFAGEWLVGELKYCWTETSARGLARRYW